MDAKRALVVLDKPKHKQTALDRALDLQPRLDLTLELAAFCWQSAVASEQLFSAEERRLVKQSMLLDRKAWQRSLVDDSGLRGVRMHTAWTDDIPSWLSRRLAKAPVDLVVKSVQPRARRVETPLDWQLLRVCPAPLLLAAPNRRKPAGRVLAAVDLRHNDRTHQRLNRRVLAAANTFAQAYGAELHCVYALEISEVLRDLDLVDERAARKRMLASAQAGLDALLAPYDVKKRNRHFPVGKVGHAVAQTAAKLKADLLVVGSYAHRVRQMVGLGNSAERILTRASTDVLAVHP